MSFAEAKAYLETAYDAHGQLVLMQETLGRVAVVGNRREVRRRVPVLSGPTGVGKTSCAKEFAADRGLQFVAIDCSYTPAGHLAARINNACIAIAEGAGSGTLILIQNFRDADEEWKEILDQYASGFLQTSIMVPDEQNPAGKRPLELHQEWIPEGVFVVGEQATE